MKKFWFVAIALAASAACSSGTPAGQGTTSTPTTGDAAAFLESVQQGLSEATFKVTYRLSGSGSDDQEITWAQDPPRSSYSFGSGADATLFIDPGDGTGQVMCSSDSCFRIAQGGANPAAAFLAPLFAFQDSLTSADDLAGFTSKGEEEIAGRTALCAEWSFAGSTSGGCSDTELGIMLRWSASSGGEGFSFEAIDFGTPADEDFEPTSEVQEIPTEFPSGAPTDY